MGLENQVKNTENEAAAAGQEKKAPPPKKKNWLMILLLIVVIVLGADLAKRFYEKRHLPDPQIERVFPVKTESLKNINGEFEVKYPGTTKAIRQVDVGFNVSGTLMELPAKAGMTIDEGDVIGKLDPRDYQNDLNAKIADYNNAKARLDRVKKLYDAAVAPKSQLDEAVAAFKVAEANMEIAQKSRDDTVLKAPFKGVIARRYVDNFQVVSQGQPIISLQDLKTLEIESYLPEWFVSKVKEAHDVEIYATYEALPGVKIPLKVKEFAAEADDQTRTYRVRFFMEKNPTDSNANILPGMTASITIKIKPANSAKVEFLVPVWSVNSNAGKNKPAVFVVNEKTNPWTVERREVQAGIMSGDNIIISGDLKEGEKIVIAGATRLQNGMKVKGLPEYIQSNLDTLDSREKTLKNEEKNSSFAPEENE